MKWPLLFRSTHEDILRRVTSEKADTELRQRCLKFADELDEYVRNGFITDITARNMQCVSNHLRKIVG